MIRGIVAGCLFAVLSASGALAAAPSVMPSDEQLSLTQKDAAIRPLVRSATDCIVKSVVADPRYGAKANVGDLIVDSVSACIDPVRALIDRHDQLFGEGSGEAFFMGPYLDVLPSVVIKQIDSAVQ